MLVISRKIGEAVVIRSGDELIRVLVIGTSGERVRLGFDAAREIVIEREEVFEARQRGRPVPSRPELSVEDLHDLGGEGGGA